ncbi:MAG: hypothetical protein LC662_06460 [Rhodothermaceae bacterium]|nr:hypothetical protein [Rhodothermaceae bacterium]
MAKLVALAKLKSRQLDFILPNIRNYNRIEGNPRSKDFDRNLKMEVRDPLWFLCRQWQFGEFHGEDAGTAYQACVMGEHSTADRIVLPNDVMIPYDTSEPLEMMIERESVDATLFLRSQMGRHFGIILKARNLKKYRKHVLEEFPLNPDLSDDDTEGAFLAKSIGTLIPDGYRIQQAVSDGDFETWVRDHPEIAPEDAEKPTGRILIRSRQQPHRVWMICRLPWKSFRLLFPVRSGSAGCHIHGSGSWKILKWILAKLMPPPHPF